MTDALLTFLAANVFAALAVVVVLVLRLPARRVFGARIAYGLWSLVPLAAAAMLLPSRTVTVVAEAAPETFVETAPDALVAAAPAAGLDPWPLAVALWLAGAAASLAWLAWRQAAFAQAARQGLAGPAVLGVVRPRIVTPGDFAHRYTAREQAVVLAHEAAHIARNDSRVNAVVALARCVAWFNPLIHVLSHVLRIDQELACDATVVAAHPQARRAYAQAMLKTQMASRPLPIGCYWPAPAVHPLAERVRLLGWSGPSRGRRRLGVTVVALLGAGMMGTAWASKPAQVVLAEPPLGEPVPAARPKPPPRPKAPAPRAKPAPAPRPAPERAPASPAPEVVAAVSELEAAADARAAPAAEPAAEVRPAREPRRIAAAAKRSRVDPGTAVRVVATYIDPDGRPLLTDLTSYGSQRYYRTGAFSRDGSRHVLFTQVIQEGETFWVTAALNRTFQGPSVGTVAMRSGETRDVVLGDGQVVKVSATARPETPEEIAAGREHMAYAAAEIHRNSQAAWAQLKNDVALGRVRCRRDAC